MKCSVVVACNNEEVLRSSLLASPDLKYGTEVVVERGARSASVAYNAGMRKAAGDLLIFAHQDVYFPAGWFERLHQAVEFLDHTRSSWAVLGVFGSGIDGQGYGHLYTTGLRSVIGSPLKEPVEVQTLDEVVLVVRRSSGLSFDEALPGFHLYGADICLEARKRGLSCHAMDAFCIHNSNGIGILPKAYWQSWLYMRRKWWGSLPVTTPCMPNTRWGTSAFRYLVGRSLWLTTHRDHVGHRVDNPETLLTQLAPANLKS